jgi:pimeloyl-ACP methyl ester carboxylesterase
LRENLQREPIETWYPPEVISRPVTAVAEVGSENRGIKKVRIRLLCPIQNPTVICQGRRQPLAADFSVPWAAALARTGKLNQSRVLDMLRRMPSRAPRLYLMEPYDPNREPLIMIHGLLSTPLAWAEMSNELWADEAIRSRYQIWHYHYNTSAPALYSARLLRTQLRDLRAMLDPEGDDPAFRKTTLLTHSMGGLIGKALVVRPGQVFWEAAFKVPHETLNLSPEDRASLEDAFEWEPEKAVHRIVFVAVPHRGSAFADHLVGRIGTWLTAPPATFQAFYARLSKANPGVFTPDYEQLGRGRLDSVSSLSPRQPTLRILADLPFAHPVKVHSIIGDRGRPGPREKSSDGIVPYSSSHLAGADSEVVVPAGHGAFRHPAAQAEIKRVLKWP